jgi:alkanesulfonate monooxygenase SsuD/methylene tetrahydromethanopterin reductase-like flavin-dependent oxidoreductase (luciferase family)
MQMVCVAPTMEEAEADLAETAGVKGWNDELIEMVKTILIYGDADTVGEQLQECMATGIDGMTINLPANGHNTERVGLVGEVALAAIAD